MAKVNPASLLAEVRGTIGSVTFSKNKSGFFAQRLRQPTTSTRPGPRRSRDIFEHWARLWTRSRFQPINHPGYGVGTVHEVWDWFAALPEQELIDPFGEPYYASGYNWWVHYQTIRSQLGEPLNLHPPTEPAATAWPNFSMFLDPGGYAGNSWISSPVTEHQGADILLLYAYMRYDTDIPAQVSPYYFITAITFPAPAEEVPIQEALVDKFGPVPVTSRLMFAVRPYEAGERRGEERKYSLQSGLTGFFSGA